MIGRQLLKSIVFTLIFLITSTVAFADNSVQVTRDDKGVWFITGPEEASRYEIFEAMGYVVAEDRLWQMELYKRQSLGRLSEIFGESQLGTDMYLRTIGYSEDELTEGVKNLGETKEVVEGYVAGINRRISELNGNPDLVPAEFLALKVYPIESWRCEDVLAWISMLQKNFDPEALDTAQVENAALYQFLIGTYDLQEGAGMFNDLRWTNDPEAQTYIVDKNKSKPTSPKAKRIVSAPPYDAETITDTADKLKKTRKKVKDKLKEINAFVKMGSYAWVVSGDKTKTGNPIIYSGPQMGFSVPSIVTEGSIRAGDLEVSGMTVPGIPGIIIGRTPHHAWSMQVGHAHTTDYYFETPESVELNRFETIKVAGSGDVTIPIYRTVNGPVVSPMPYIPDTYDSTKGPIVSWKYSQWGHEFDTIGAFLELGDAQSMDEFGEGIEKIGVSQHFCYADRDGNIAYWMSGRNPVRPAGEWRLPQGALSSFGILPLEWDSDVLVKRSTARNPKRGYFGGWNNKTHPDYDNAYNSVSDIYGPFHRSHVIYDYFDKAFKKGRRLSFGDVRDLALNIATTDSFGGGGNPWKFVDGYFTAAVEDANEKKPVKARKKARKLHSKRDGHFVAAVEDTNDKKSVKARKKALKLLSKWDGHFVAGGLSEWAEGEDRSDAWVLMNEWIDEVLILTFKDEIGVDQYGELTQSKRVLFNVLVHGLAGADSGIVNNYDWFTNSDPNATQTAEEIIVEALDTVLTRLGDQPWGIGTRGEIEYKHSMFGTIHSHPFSSRSTYAHCVEYGEAGPVRIESMFPLGQSGNILFNSDGSLNFNEHVFSMTPVFDNFVYRGFPLFD